MSISHCDMCGGSYGSQECQALKNIEMPSYHKSACDLDFDRKTCSNLDEIWLKNQECYEDALA